MPFKLNPDSRKLLPAAKDEILIGVAREASKIIHLYRDDKRTSRVDGVFPGHTQLVTSGELPAEGYCGFSFHVGNGKIQAFYRNSVLNLHRPHCSIRIDEMDSIIRALELIRSEDFSSYP